jgi:hypothetical protein
MPFSDGPVNTKFHMSKAILIPGLPGASKTLYGERLLKELGAREYVDDYHAEAIDHKPDFDHGRRYREMMAGLLRGETWIASDIEWCRPGRRVLVEKGLRLAVPDVEIEWHFIAADPEVCRVGGGLQAVFPRG